MNNNIGSDSHAGVRRSRDTDDVTTSTTSKRQKLDHENLKIHSPKDVHVNSSPELSTSAVNDDLCIDPKVEDDTSNSSSNGFRETTSASSEICLDSDEMESSSTLKNNNKKKKIVAPRSPSCKVTVTNNPTAAEIDDFFAAAEKNEQKRFKEKYNYDFVNDVPMEGRYQWVRLKP